MRRCDKCGFKFSNPPKSRELTEHRKLCSKEYAGRYLRAAQSSHATKRKAPITLPSLKGFGNVN